MADNFCRSYNLEGERHIMNTAAHFCARCTIYTCYNNIRKRSSLYFCSICCSSVLVCLTIFFSFRRHIGTEYSNLVAKLDRHTNVIQIWMKQKLRSARCCGGNKRGLL
jgi:hypothetical protein